MNASTAFDKDLLELYDGRKEYWAERMKVSDTRNEETGKCAAKYCEHSGPIPAMAGKRHLDDPDFGLVITPQREDGTCVFGVIDVDQYSGLNFPEICRAVNGKLIVGTSKSEGMHLTAYLPEPGVSYTRLEAVLQRIGKLLNFEHFEVFPKIPNPGKKPRGVNIPYSGRGRGLHHAVQYAVKNATPNATKSIAIDIVEFLNTAKQIKATTTIEGLEQLANELSKNRAADKTVEETPNSLREEALSWVNIGAEKIRFAPKLRADHTLNRELYAIGRWDKHLTAEDKFFIRDLYLNAWSARKHADALAEEDFYKCWPHSYDDGAAKGDPYRRNKSKAKLITTPMSAVKSRRTDWVWKGWFAHGEITLVTGRKGTGKSHLVCLMAVTIVKGGEWPFGGGRAPKGPVLYITAEENPETTLKPHMQALGATDEDLDNIILVKGITTEEDGETVLNLTQNTPLLEQYLLESPLSFVAVIMDPVSDFMGEPKKGKRDTNSTMDVRGFLHPLNKLAREQNFCLPLVHHPPKASTGAHTHGSGSYAWLTGPRITAMTGNLWEMVEDEEGGRKKHKTPTLLLARGPSNIGAEPETLAYVLEEVSVSLDDGTTDTVTRATFTGTAPYSADEVAGDIAGVKEQTSGGKVSPGKVAEAFIRRVLKSGPMWATDVHEMAEAEDIKNTTLMRAARQMEEARELFIVKQKDVPHGKYVWSRTTEIQWDLLDSI